MSYSKPNTQTQMNVESAKPTPKIQKPKSVSVKPP